ncbi:MAG: hypothetical protein IPL26_19605 [Leptospiraceae bacterium]|nr:hypothetical protein [Leptospiraceae bacterium]
MIQQLEISFSELPVSKIFNLDGKDFELRFTYNSKFDFISVEIYIDTEFLHSTKLMYGSDIFTNTNLSSIPLIPYSSENLSKEKIDPIAVNKETFGKSVFLMFEDGSN